MKLDITSLTMLRRNGIKRTDWWEIKCDFSFVQVMFFFIIQKNLMRTRRVWQGHLCKAAKELLKEFLKPHLAITNSLVFHR